MSAINRHYLNGVDVYLAYGLLITDGGSGFLTTPERKDSVSNDWADENGLDVDLSNPKFKNTRVALNCHMIFNNVADYKVKKKALENVLCSGGLLEWRVVDHQETYLVYYKSETGTNKITGTLDGGQAYTAVAFTLNFERSIKNDDVPNPNAGDPVIVYNPDGTVFAIVPAGGSVTINHSGNSTEYEYSGADVVNKKLLISAYSLTDQYDVLIYGYEQPENSYTVSRTLKQITFSEDIPTDAFLTIRVYNPTT